MEKRALIAVAIAFAILLVYQYFFMPPQPQRVQKSQKIEEKTVTATTPETSAQAMPATPVAQKKTATSGEKDVRVETELYSAVFSTKGATVKYFALKKYTDKGGKEVVLLKAPGAEPPLALGTKDDFNLSGLDFSLNGRDVNLDKNNKTASLIFEYADSGYAIKRTYTFYNDSYRIDVKDEVSGLPDYWITLGSDFGIYDSKDTSSHIGPVLLKDTDRMDFDAKKLAEAKTYSQGLKWIAQEDKYFFASLVPQTPMEEARLWKIKDSAVAAFRGKPGTNSFILYAGPKEYNELKGLNVGLEHIIDFGFFSIIALPLFWVLKLFYSLTGNYGWAIVLLTTIVRIPFIPLVNKSQKAMKIG